MRMIIFFHFYKLLKSADQFKVSKLYGGDSHSGDHNRYIKPFQSSTLKLSKKNMCSYIFIILIKIWWKLLKQGKIPCPSSSFWHVKPPLDKCFLTSVFGHHFLQVLHKRVFFFFIIMEIYGLMRASPLFHPSDTV